MGANTAITGWSLADSIALLHRLEFPVIEIHPMGNPAATPGQFPGFRFDQLSRLNGKPFADPCAALRT